MITSWCFSYWSFTPRRISTASRSLAGKGNRLEMERQNCSFCHRVPVTARRTGRDTFDAAPREQGLENANGFEHTPATFSGSEIEQPRHEKDGAGLIHKVGRLSGGDQSRGIETQDRPFRQDGGHSVFCNSLSQSLNDRCFPDAGPPSRTGFFL